MKKIVVKTSTEYTVLIGNGLLKSAGALISQTTSPCRICVVCDEHVLPLYYDALSLSLTCAGFDVDVFPIKSGESSKSVAVFAELLEFLAKKQYTRRDILVALGGGVTGDLTGFAASAYLRGIDFVQIPTTFLAAIDSSVGGKTGINLQSGKNLAGAFHQPRLVICDTDTFVSLPQNIMSDGISEAIKYGVICDKALFDLLSESSRWDTKNVVAMCVSDKRNMVQADEFDTGLRQHLNFGHTIGHAIEKCSNYTVSHGSAVAVGMYIISKAAEKSDLCRFGTSTLIKSALKLYNLPISCNFSAHELAHAALQDKKRSGDMITLVLPRQIGDSFLHKMPIDQLACFISQGLEGE